MEAVSKQEASKKRVIILGVNSRIYELIEILQQSEYELTIVSRFVDSIRDSVHGVEMINSDFLHRDVLQRLDLEHCYAVVILAESQDLSPKDIDARSVVATLSIESINKDVRTVVEILHEETAFHLKNAGVDEIIRSGALTADILAFSINHTNFSQHLDILLRYTHKNRIVTCSVAERFIGKFLGEVVPLMAKNRKILLGVRPEGVREDETLDPTYVLSAEDCFVYIDML